MADVAMDIASNRSLQTAALDALVNELGSVHASRRTPIDDEDLACDRLGSAERDHLRRNVLRGRDSPQYCLTPLELDDLIRQAVCHAGAFH